jgi:hypothetical protein
VHKLIWYLWHEVKLHTRFAVSFMFNLVPSRTDGSMAME